jgi:hypothetical protein
VPRGHRVLIAAVALTVAAAAAEALRVWAFDSASTAGSFDVRLLSEAASTVTLGWESQRGDGYRFYVNGVPVARTLDPSRTSVRVAKAHSYEIEVLLLSGGASGRYPPNGNSLELSGTLAAAEFTEQLSAAQAGPVTVRPAPGQRSFTVTGDVALPREDVTIQSAVFTGVVTLSHASDGATIADSTLFGFDASRHSDNWTIRDSVIDSDCQKAQNFIFGSHNWRIIDNTLRNFHYCPDETTHSEALFIGAGNDGFLISGNHFYDNGTTGQIFFSWFPSTAGATEEYPRNGCVTGNTFEGSRNKFHEIDMRNDETFPEISTIHIDPDTNVNLDAPGNVMASVSTWETPC